MFATLPAVQTALAHAPPGAGRSQTRNSLVRKGMATHVISATRITAVANVLTRNSGPYVIGTPKNLVSKMVPISGTTMSKSG